MKYKKDMSLDNINEATRQCVENCRATADPLGAALKCLEEVRLSFDLTDEEVQQVLVAVVRQL
jgi:hypothetical protein